MSLAWYLAVLFLEVYLIMLHLLHSPPPPSLSLSLSFTAGKGIEARWNLGGRHTNPQHYRVKRLIACCLFGDWVQSFETTKIDSLICLFSCAFICSNKQSLLTLFFNPVSAQAFSNENSNIRVLRTRYDVWHVGMRFRPVWGNSMWCCTTVVCVCLLMCQKW